MAAAAVTSRRLRLIWPQQLKGGSRKAVGTVPKPSSVQGKPSKHSAQGYPTAKDRIHVKRRWFKNQSTGKYEHSLFSQPPCPKDTRTRAELGNQVQTPLADRSLAALSSLACCCLVPETDVGLNFRCPNPSPQAESCTSPVVALLLYELHISAQRLPSVKQETACALADRPSIIGAAGEPVYTNGLSWERAQLCASAD